MHPNDKTYNPKEQVFVFGSNLAGIHGAGAAKTALLYGAKWGIGLGHQGNTYAIPTKDNDLKTLPLENIRKYVESFLLYAKDNPGTLFFVTRIGCGLAGYKDEDISPLFADATPNCILPKGW